MSVLYGRIFGRMIFASMKCLAKTSSGCPSRSYMARKNSGSITIIMPRAAILTFPDLFSRKNVGTPTNAAAVKQTSCLFVMLKRILDLTLVRSLGTGI